MMETFLCNKIFFFKICYLSLNKVFQNKWERREEEEGRGSEKEEGI